jgi:hypothetical protein
MLKAGGLEMLWHGASALAPSSFTGGSIREIRVPFSIANHSRVFAIGLQISFGGEGILAEEILSEQGAQG